MKWVLRTLGVVILAAGCAYAFGFFILFSAKSAHVIHRIETREVHPDYVFVLRTECYRWEGWAGGGSKEFREVRFAEISPDNPLVLELDRWPEEVVEGTEWRERAYLAIIPRAVAAQYETAKECADAGASREETYFGWGGRFRRGTLKTRNWQ